MYTFKFIAGIEIKHTNTDDDQLYIGYCLEKMVKLRHKVSDVSRKMGYPDLEITITETSANNSRPIILTRINSLIKDCKKEFDELVEQMEECAGLFHIPNRVVTLKIYKPSKIKHDIICESGIFIND